MYIVIKETISVVFFLLFLYTNCLYSEENHLLTCDFERIVGWYFLRTFRGQHMHSSLTNALKQEIKFYLIAKYEYCTMHANVEWDIFL